ncbi:MAG: MFS transporter [Verrucomicrobia bacterium]|nr:MFS transporter [Verrucomicrobiota bacterium]MBU1735521.1 MFS transporter [Verrucomicrobiota bacterium]MBU1858134.1 MFS transporter [Verrucomicrobiota bacterium]
MSIRSSPVWHQSSGVWRPSSFLARARQMNPQLKLFLVGVALLSITGGIGESTFNNFLSDTFDLNAAARGLLEFPRELPGLLTALFAGALFFLSETRIAAFSALCIGVGMLGIAIWGASWTVMLVFMFVWNAGMHMMMPVRSSIGMELAHAEHKGRRLGQIQGFGIAASIVGCALVWILMKYIGAGYRTMFIIGGLVALLAAFILFTMWMPNAHLQRPKFVFRRQYWLYYTLAFLFGARKQIFITFGPWVLIKIFHQPAYIFAQLWMVAGALGIFFQPALGRAIDRFGERWVLVVDSGMVFLVCIGYGYAHLVGSHALALGVLYTCFVGDLLLFGTNIARDTYLAKIALKPEDVAPSLSLGVSINHAVSMSVPALGGLMWMKYGHASVFLAAAGVAVVMLFFSNRIRTGRV